jgi:hypothetical protein
MLWYVKLLDGIVLKSEIDLSRILFLEEKQVSA